MATSGRFVSYSWRLCAICFVSLCLSLLFIAVQQGTIRVTHFVPIQPPSHLLGDASNSQSSLQPASRLPSPPLRNDLQTPGSSLSPARVTSFEKPANLKIIGLVFYGRKETVEILNCYLQVSYQISLQ